jgi:iron(III) transport system ATP-binding protein
MTSALLAVQGLTRQVSSKAVLDAVSFVMQPGEVLAVLGPSGSGKTSLLRLIAGFEAPSDGHVLLQGQTVSAPGQVRVPPEARRMGLAFQDATLFPHLDALDNAAFAVRHGSREQRRAAAELALQGMGLQGMAGRDVASLSGGEAQRVSLARALAADAQLLLLDEPFGNVDRLTRVDLIKRLKARLAQPGQGAIIVTHDPADAVELGARVLLLQAGRLVADGRYADIVAGSCGSWAQTFLSAA